MKSKDNGKAVACNLEAPATKSTASASTASSRNTEGATANFQALDMNGKVEATCDAKGYVFLPDRAASIGEEVHEFVFKVQSTFFKGSVLLATHETNRRLL